MLPEVVSSCSRILIGVLCLILPLWVSADVSSHGNAKKIIFWHSMSGTLGLEVKRLANQFNHRQADYEVIPIYKGDYTESLTSFAAAFRAKQPPNLIQVFEVGTSVMLYPEGIVKPVDVLMKEQGISIPKENFFSAVRDTYSVDDSLFALPFNVSIPVLFYNADALAPLGISPETFPKTWDAFEQLVKRLRDSGFDCAYTTAYPAWILIESYAALHGINNIYSNPYMLAHLKRMRRWQERHYFDYGGHIDDSTVLFTSGRCPLFSQSSGAYAGLSDLVSFHLGVAPLPLDTRSSLVRNNNVVGGGAIWVTAGQSSDIEHGIAMFFAFLTEPNVQQTWYEHTGYLPLDNHTKHDLSKRFGSILEIAENDLNHKIAPSVTRQAGPKNQIRMIDDQMLESIFAGMMSVEEAMIKTMARTRYVLYRFMHNTR